MNLDFDRMKIGEIRVTIFATVIAIATLFGSVEPALAAAITVESDSQGSAKWIRLSGEISRDDVSRLEAAISTMTKSSLFELYGLPNLVLDSPGGDVMAAIKMGRLVRSNAMSTLVPDYDGARCYSACVFIFLGGVKRLAGSPHIGIHRPKFNEEYFAGLSEAEARAEYKKMTAEVEAYLTELGADSSLFQKMMRIPSGQMLSLTDEELEAMAVVGEDPSYAEWSRAKDVQRYGEEFVACTESQKHQDYVLSAIEDCKKDKSKEATCLAEHIERDPCHALERPPQ